MPPNGRSRPPQAAPPNASRAESTTVRGPYLTELGMLTTCPLHPWAAPSLSMIDGTAPVCWETGHLWDEGDVLRAAR